MGGFQAWDEPAPTKPFTVCCGVLLFCVGVWLSVQDGEPVSKNAEKILEKGKEALDEKTGAVEQHKVRGGKRKDVNRRVCSVKVLLS